MQVHIITKSFNTHFKQNKEPHTFGYDDDISKSKRDYIREWHDKQYIPYQSIYEKEGRMSEFELKLLISDLVQKPIQVNKKIFNIGLINLRSIGKGIYRGAMLGWDNIRQVEQLHEAGIRTIIPIGSGFSELQEQCEKFGIKYLPIKFDSEEKALNSLDSEKSLARYYAERILDLNEKETETYINNHINSWRNESRKFIDEFTNYIQTMQKGNIYMGCEFGRYNTDTAVMFDYLFNPKMKHGSGLNMYNDRFILCAKNLYENLTDTDKLKMGWTKDFEQTFHERLSKLEDQAY